MIRINLLPYRAARKKEIITRQLTIGALPLIATLLIIGLLWWSINEKNAARLLGIAVQTLRNWRHQRRGPAYVKMGRSVRYQLKDIQDYLDKRKIDPEGKKVFYY